MSASSPRLAIDNDTPQRLSVVAAQFGLTAAALRTEAKRGRLVISRVAGKDWTSVAEVNRMFGLCRSTPKESDFWLRPARGNERATFVIRDGAKQVRTGCAQSELIKAQRVLADYIARQYRPDRSSRAPSQVRITDVLNIYAQDVATTHARPYETAHRLAALSEYWGDRPLSAVNGKTCREYVQHAGSPAAARRHLEDFRAAIIHHRREGYCSEVIEVVLPGEESAARTMADEIRSRPPAKGLLARRTGPTQARRPVHSGGLVHRHAGQRHLRRGYGADTRPRARRPQSGSLLSAGARLEADEQATAARSPTAKALVSHAPVEARRSLTNGRCRV